MKIVILDGYAINPGDLSWEALRGLGELEVFDRTSESDVVVCAGDADVLLTDENTYIGGNDEPAQAITLYRGSIHRVRPDRPEGGARA